MVNDFVRPNKNNKSRFLPIIIFSFALGLLIALGIKNFSPKRQTSEDIVQNAVLTLESDKDTVTRGEEFTVTMTLDSQNTEVAAADFVVHFDPKLLKVITVSTGNYFSNYPLNITGDDYIKLSGVASFDGNTLVLPKGNGTIGSIKFQALNDKGNAVIKYNKTHTIVATSGKNIIDENKLAKIFVKVAP